MATTDPTATANNGSFDIAAAIAAAQGSGGAGATKDPAIVPLWKVRPSVAPPPNRRNGGQQEPSDAQSSDLARMAAAPVTATEASSTWLDMSDDDRKAFYKLALNVGLVSASGGVSPAELERAWDTAVKTAAQYNAKQKDATGYLSPWEAASKLGLQSAAGQGAQFNQFGEKPPGPKGDPWAPRTSTTAQAKVYNEGDLAANADTIMHNELGRKPTADEVRAFTIAVNAASAANPVMTTTTTTPTGSATQGGVDQNGVPFDAQPTSANSASVTHGGIDANQIMTQSAQANPEYGQMQASNYLNALLHSLGATA